MPRVFIIGYGNPLRGDDGLGWHAVQRLADSIHDPDVVISAVHQLTPDLAEPLSRSQIVIFIDAGCDNKGGDLVFRQVTPDSIPPQTFSHQLTPEVLLGMAKSLYGACSEASLLTLPGRSIEFGEGLSAEIQSALPALLERVHQIVGDAHAAVPPAQSLKRKHDEETENTRR